MTGQQRTMDNLRPPSSFSSWLSDGSPLHKFPIPLYLDSSPVSPMTPMSETPVLHHVTWVNRDISFDNDSPTPRIKGRHLLRKIWFVALLSGLMNVFSMLEANVMLPFLYTRVVCCADDTDDLSSHYDITGPLKVSAIFAEAKRLRLQTEFDLNETSDFISACAVPQFSPGSDLWSLSPSCPNKAFVQDSAQRIIAKSTPLQKLLGLVLMPVGGAIADATGRRRVLFAYAAGIVVANTLLVLDTELHRVWSDYAVIIALMLFCICWDPKDSVLNGCVADIVGADEETKGRAFAALLSMNTVGSVLALFITFHCLKLHLENYFGAWLGFLSISFGAVLVLCGFVPETLPEDIRRPFSADLLNPIRSYVEAFKIIVKDRVLLIIAFIVFLWGVHFVGWITMHFSYLVMVGFTMEEAVLPGAVGMLCQVFFALIMVRMLPMIGAWTSYITGHLMFVVAYTLWGPYTIIVGHSGPYLAYLAQALAFAFYTPAGQTIVSQRVDRENQAKIMAAMCAMLFMGAIIGTPFYSNVLFDATAEGVERMCPALVSAGLAFVSVLLAMLARAADVDQTSHEILQEDETDFENSPLMGREEMPAY